jgi:hypothetical protein
LKTQIIKDIESYFDFVFENGYKINENQLTKKISKDFQEIIKDIQFIMCLF